LGVDAGIECLSDQGGPQRPAAGILDFTGVSKETHLMAVDFETITKEALGLTPRQRLKLAEVLLVSAEREPEGNCQGEWDAEIEARIHAIDQGHETGIPFEEVMAAADKLLSR
jgi:putative addiction module component (TIGR02574 family)